MASEVRALAQRSAEAAKEIKGLISTSGAQVSHGVKLVGDTGTALARIITRVSDITAIVGDMATSAGEQASALQEVNTAISHMDQITQQNAAMVEQSTAASQSLAQETSALADFVKQFRIGAVQDCEPSTTGHKQSYRSQPPDRLALPAGSSSAATQRKAIPMTDKWDEF